MAHLLLSVTSASSALGSYPLSFLHAEVAQNKAKYYGWRVVKVDHLKEKTSVGHEFHVLTLRKGADAHEILVRVERRPGLQRIGMSLSSESLTDDSICRLDHNTFRPSDYHHISTTFCKEQPALTVLEMCVICAFIRKVAPTYSLAKSTHCFWFCAAFLIQLRTCGYSHAMEKGADHSKRACFRLFRAINEESVEKELRTAAQPRALSRAPRQLFRRPSRAQLRPEGTDWVPGVKLTGHTALVTSVCFTATGRHILSGSSDKTIRLWDAATGKMTQQFPGVHSGIIYSLALSPDGRRVVSASMDNTLCIWDFDAGVPIHEALRGHTGTVASVASSPDGSKVLSGSHDTSLRIWDAETAAAIGGPFSAGSAVTSVAWSSDGRRLVAGMRDHTVRTFDAVSGSPVGEPLRGHEGVVNSVDVSPDGKRIVSGSSDRTVRIWDAASGEEMCAPIGGHTKLVHCVAFSPDGRWIASGSAGRTVHIYDSYSEGAMGQIAEFDAGSEVWSVAWSPLGEQIAVGCQDSSIRAWTRCVPFEDDY